MILIDLENKRIVGKCKAKDFTEEIKKLKSLFADYQNKAQVAHCQRAFKRGLAILCTSFSPLLLGNCV